LPVVYYLAVAHLTACVGVPPNGVHHLPLVTLIFIDNLCTVRCMGMLAVWEFFFLNPDRHMLVRSSTSGAFSTSTFANPVG